MSPYTHATHFMTDNINGTSPRCRMKQKRSMIRLTTTATRTEGGLPVLKVSNESPNNELTCDHVMKTLLPTTHARSGIKLGFLSFSGCRSLLLFLFRRMIFRLRSVNVSCRPACRTWSVRFSRNFLLITSNFKHKFNWFLPFLSFLGSPRHVCGQENHSIYNSK